MIIIRVSNYFYYFLEKSSAKILGKSISEASSAKIQAQKHIENIYIILDLNLKITAL